MKTSISPRPLSSAALPSGPALSRSSRMVEAGRAFAVSLAASAMRSTRGAGLRLHVCALVDPRHARQQVIDLGLGRPSDGRARLALRGRRNHAALLQHVFAYREAGAGLLLIADQRQMRIEQIVCGIALA